MIIRSLLRKCPLRLQKSYVTLTRRRLVINSVDPLRILFCGADEFSIASLEALDHEKKVNPELIESLDVVCKVGKKHGRGLKNVREVPIVDAAQELSLPLHKIENFTGWECPRPQGQGINLVIAVSFGLLIPPRILQNAKYGGINVHPSLLPDFRGAAPIHWALLHNCKATGITLQTLHHHYFDQGDILLQTPHPGLEIPNPNTITPNKLSAFLAPKGAELLLQGLRERVILSGSNPKPRSSLTRPAPKITPQDRHIDWGKWSAQEILCRHRVIGPLWSKAAAGRLADGNEKRIIWSSGFEKVHATMEDTEPGLGLISASDSAIYVPTIDQQILRAESAIVEGSGMKPASHAVKKAGMVNFDPRHVGETTEALQLWSPFT
ncbi:Methionyl-tRNA formyltransferase [Xylographa carneopallida]|nr:Methionyl-tRNA formyltransferase [Xylographa carneopallida]